MSYELQKVYSSAQAKETSYYDFMHHTTILERPEELLLLEKSYYDLQASYYDIKERLREICN
jgi:hypothetical protein